MRPTIYVETTIFSYLTARPTANVVAAARQQGTRTWWATRRDVFALFISELVLEEAADGDPEAAERRLILARPLPLVNVTERALALAPELQALARLPARAGADALHIALAAVHGIDYLLTWNLRHIANAELRPHLDAACRARGYRPPILCTPDELMGEVPEGGDRER
jgi:predicted nucleic acid-binding protein